MTQPAAFCESLVVQFTRSTFRLPVLCAEVHHYLEGVSVNVVLVAAGVTRCVCVCVCVGGITMPAAAPQGMDGW